MKALVGMEARLICALISLSNSEKGRGEGYSSRLKYIHKMNDLLLYWPDEKISSGLPGSRVYEKIKMKLIEIAQMRSCGCT